MEAHWKTQWRAVVCEVVGGMYQYVPEGIDNFGVELLKLLNSNSIDKIFVQ